MKKIAAKDLLRNDEHDIEIISEARPRPQQDGFLECRFLLSFLLELVGFMWMN